MFSIYTWGWGSNLYETLTAVQFFIANPYYFIGTALVIGLCVVAFKSIFSQIDEKHALVGFFVVIGLFLIPGNQTFIIEDEATGQAQPISNLPLGIGFFLVIESNFERDLSAMAKNGFNTPNSIAMENVGIGFSMTASLELEEAMPRDDLLVQTFDHYTNNCLLSALATGEKTMTTITNSGNLVGDLAVSNTFETLVFDIADPTGRQESCQTAWANISARMDVESNAFIQNKITPLTGLPVDRVNDGLAGTSNLLYGVSASGKDLVLQKMSKNLLNNGLMAVGQIVGGDTATAALMAAQTEQQTKGSWIGAGLQAQKTLPMIRIIGTSLLISSIVILAWLSIAMASFRVMAFVLVGLTTLATWQPLATIINYQYYSQLEKILQPISGGALAPIYSTGDINDAIQNYLANLMWWYSAIPMFSYTILTMSGMGMMYMMRDASSTSTGASTGTNIGGGIVQMGNTTVGNNTQENDRVGTGTYVGTDGITTKVNSNGAMETTNVGTTSDGTSYGVKTTSSPMGSSQVVNTDGAGTIGLDGQGHIRSMSGANWNAGTDAAQQYQHAQAVANEQTAQTQFNEGLSKVITNGMRNGSNITDSSNLSKTLGLDNTTTSELKTVTSQAVGKSFTSAFNEDERTEILQRANAEIGAGVNGQLKVGTPGEGLLGSGLSATVGADGRVSLSGTRADGSSYGFALTGEESKRYMQQFDKTLSQSLSEKEGLSLDLARNINISSGQEHAELKNAQSSYTEAHAATEKSSELFNRVEQYAQSHKVDLAPKILNEFIQNDSHLATQWNAPGSDHARIAAEAANRIQNAQLDANNNQVDARNFQSSISSVYSEFAHANGLVGSVNTQIKEGQVEAQPVIDAGKREVEDFNVKPVETTLNTQMGDYKSGGAKFKAEAQHDASTFQAKHGLNVKGDVDAGIAKLEQRVDDKQNESIAQPVIDAINSGHAAFPSMNQKARDEAGAAALSKAQESGLLSDNWTGGETIQNSKKFAGMSTDELKALHHGADNSFGNGLSDAAKQQINEEIARREFEQRNYGNASDVSHNEVAHPVKPIGEADIQDMIKTNFPIEHHQPRHKVPHASIETHNGDKNNFTSYAFASSNIGSDIKQEIVVSSLSNHNQQAINNQSEIDANYMSSLFTAHVQPQEPVKPVTPVQPIESHVAPTAPHAQTVEHAPHVQPQEPVKPVTPVQPIESHVAPTAPHAQTVEHAPHVQLSKEDIQDMIETNYAVHQHGSRETGGVKPKPKTEER